MKEDGSEREPLLTITAADIAEMGIQGEPQQGRITLQEFKEKVSTWCHAVKGTI
jgi:anaerobic dimethyl sulfoxide reductase subunit A